MRNVICLIICILLIASLGVVAGKNKGSKAQGADYEFVYDNPDILSFEIFMSAEAYQRMQPEDRDWSEPVDPERTSSRTVFGLKFNYVEASVTCNEQEYKGVGVRYRGNASMRMIPPDGKKPIKIDFDKYNPGQTFHGFKKMNFINCFRDPSMLRDKLTYDLMNKVGIPAPRSTFANLYLNIEGKEREHLGLFVAVEQVDSVFLQDRFNNSTGLLIKGELNRDLSYRGPKWDSYSYDHELKSNPENSNTLFLIEFLKFLCESSDEQFAEKIEQYFNVDGFLSWLAVNTLLVNMDSYAGLYHNWYLYYNTDTEKFEHIPWDVNEAFANLQLGTPQEMIDFSVYRPYVGDRILVRRILNIEKYNEQYLDYIQEYIDGVFAPEAMHIEMQRLHDFISDAVEADSHEIYSAEDFKRSLDEMVAPKFPIFSSGIIGLKTFVTERVASIKAQLAGEREGHLVKDIASGEPPKRPKRSKKDIEARRKALTAKLEETDAAIDRNPDDADLYVRKGEAIGQLLELGVPADMMKYGPQLLDVFNKAVQLDPENVGGRMGRGMVRLHAPEMFGGDVDGAISDLKFVLSKDLANIQANLMIGIAYERKGLKNEAIAQFEKVLKMDPKNEPAKQLLKKMRQGDEQY